MSDSYFENRYPDPVPKKDQPDHTPENIPDDVLEEAIDTAVRYGKCSDCGTEAFYSIIPHQNHGFECDECGNRMNG